MVFCLLIYIWYLCTVHMFMCSVHTCPRPILLSFFLFSMCGICFQIQSYITILSVRRKRNCVLCGFGTWIVLSWCTLHVLQLYGRKFLCLKLKFLVTYQEFGKLDWFDRIDIWSIGKNSDKRKHSFVYASPIELYWWCYCNVCGDWIESDCAISLWIWFCILQKALFRPSINR